MTTDNCSSSLQTRLSDRTAQNSR